LAIGDLQSAIDTAVARTFLYRFLAKAFEDPTEDAWCWLTSAGIQPALRSAVVVLTEPEQTGLRDAAHDLAARLKPEAFEAFQSDYLAAFGHAARGLCPLNEIEYGDIKADALFQPHRLADLAAFYRAFGLELAGDATERHDHICLELEFMSVLAAKEAYALEHQLDADQLALCREAEKKFLREHLGRWTPAFTRRLAKMVGDGALGALADFTREFVASDCARFGVPPGSEDLLLRPVDAAAESICASCGLTNLPPGALRTDS
jgi:DMSO reductase family type II enzyme chaperone